MVYKHALIIHSCQFSLTLVGIVSNMPERPSPVNDPATAQQILQPLQGSDEQVAPPTTSSSQAGLTSVTTASGDNASQSSSQENAMGSNVSNNPTVTLEVFSFNVLVLYSSRSLLVTFFLLLNVTFPLYVFSVTREPVFSLCAWSTWSVIYSVGLAMLRCLLVLGDNLLLCIMFRCYARLFFFSFFVFFWTWVAIYHGSCFLFFVWPVEDRRNYLCCLHLRYLGILRSGSDVIWYKT